MSGTVKITGDTSVQASSSLMPLKIQDTKDEEGYHNGY